MCKGLMKLLMWPVNETWRLIDASLLCLSQSAWGLFLFFMGNINFQSSSVFRFQMLKVCAVKRERDERRMHKPHNQYYHSTFSLSEDCLCYHHHHHHHHHFYRQLFISKDSYLPRPHHFPLKWETSDNIQQLIYDCSWHRSCQTIWSMHLFIEVKE